MSAADVDDLEQGRLERLSEVSVLVAWAVHQIVGSQADSSWHDKFGSFRNFLEFFRPPFVMLPEDNE